MAEESTQLPPPRRPLTQLIWALLLNAVPLYGVFVAGWRWGTLLALYWCENLLVALFLALRMIVHRRLTRKRGYLSGDVSLRVAVNGNPREFHSRSFILEFLSVVLTCSLGQAAFLSLFIFLPWDGAPPVYLDPPSLLKGIEATALLLLAGFLIDLPGLGDRPFAWIRMLHRAALDRVAVLFVTIALGIFIYMFLRSLTPVFLVFVYCKLLLDIGYSFKKRSPDEPPAWAAWIIGKLQTKRDFREFWRKERRKEREQEERQARRDEQVLRVGD